MGFSNRIASKVMCGDNYHNETDSNSFHTEMADPSQAATSTEEDFVVTHERVAGKVNYSKLIERFGSQPIPQSLIDRVERLTKRPAHPFLKRGFFFSHRYGTCFTATLDTAICAHQGENP